ncbi:MAG: cardiolipin synthase [Coriobacteriia bacterium]|nr:cardiolipin synthase [Coriobacteriia bacterium]
MVTTFVGIAVYVYVIGVAVLLIWEDRDPTTTLAWLLLLIFLPVLGIPLYLLFGRNWRWRRRASRIAHEIDTASATFMDPIRAANADLIATCHPSMQGSDIAKISHSIEAQCGATPLPARSVDVIASGEEKFRRLIEDIDGARSFVHLQYFIWECDGLTGHVVDALKRKVAEGVEVRLTYDLVGSLWYGKEQLRALEAAGAQVRADITNVNKLNYRNHRKIVVIDGCTGYTGGFNVGQEYIDGGRRFPAWRDTHLRITGPFVAELQRLFAGRWYESTGESLFSDRYFPCDRLGIDEPRFVLQIEHSSVESEWEAIRQSFILAITNANERVWISSPYFVPDAALYDAMVATALSGVDVRLVMTGWPDKRIAFWAAHSYYRRFLEAGGRIYQYRAGFYHPKAITFDGAYCTIGTANFDVRSLQLHSELTVWMFEREITAVQDRLFEADMAASHEITLDEVRRYSAVRRFRNSLMRLGAKML